MPASNLVSTESPARLNRFFVATFIVCVICIGLGLTSYFSSIQIILFAGALACGWSETDGLCGSAHVCSFAAIRGLKGRRGWFISILAYTACGFLTAATVGVVINALGALLPITSATFAAIIVLLTVLLVARELRIISFELPQVHLQTQKMWAPQFGFFVAAGMWGAHIGLGVATVIKHGGFYLVAAASAFLGPVDAVMLMTAYWFGRTLPMWCGEFLTRGQTGEALFNELHAEEGAYRVAANVGMILIALASVRTAWPN